MEKYHGLTYHYGKAIADQKAHELEVAINESLKKTAI